MRPEKPDLSNDHEMFVTYCNPTVRRCCPISLMISWLVLSMGTMAGTSPLKATVLWWPLVSTAPFVPSSTAASPLRTQPFAVGCCIGSMQLMPPLLFLRDFLRGGPAPSSPDDSPVEARLIFKVRRGQVFILPPNKHNHQTDSDTCLKSKKKNVRTNVKLSNSTPLALCPIRQRLRH